MPEGELRGSHVLPSSRIALGLRMKTAPRVGPPRWVMACVEGAVLASAWGLVALAVYLVAW